MDPRDRHDARSRPDPARPADLPLADPAEVGLDRQGLARIEGWLAAEVARGRLPGAVALVARRGRIAWLHAVGAQDPAAGTPMRADAIFRVYSMTKPLVSLAALLLAEEGRLLLTAPLSRWLPRFAAPRVLDEDADGRARLRPAARPITVQDLLRHTAGLSYEFIAQGELARLYQAADLGSRQRDNAAFCDALAALPLACDPGTRWEYSRATDVLGRLVEIVSGLRLGEFLARRLFGPLGMVDTGFAVPPAQRHRIAEPFAHDPDGGEPLRLIDPTRTPAFESGGGGLVSTAADYARFLAMMLAGGRAPDGARVVSPATLALMTADHLGAIPVAGDLLAPGHGFGLGVAVRTRAGLAPLPGSVGQWFWSGIAGTSFWVDPSDASFAILLTQAPNQRDEYRQAFRWLVHAALD